MSCSDCSHCRTCEDAFTEAAPYCGNYEHEDKEFRGLNNDNYFSLEAGRRYWSVSQFKAFNKCEACGLAQSMGLYFPEVTDALLIGSYVDSYFSGEFEDFQKREGVNMFKRNGQILAKFAHANEIIDAIASQPKMVEFMEGEKQTIMTADLFGVPWKIKTDFYNEKRIVDLKVVKDFESLYDPSYGGYRSWVEYWGYDIQGYIYTRVEQAVTGRPEPLPFYILAVTKERVPDVDLFQIPEHVLEAAGALVEAKIDRFDLIKQGEVEPIRCERCDYCKRTKVITEPGVYEIEEAKD